VLAVVLVVAALIAADALVVGSRIDRTDVRLSGQHGTTWVLAGLDSRAHLPAGATVTQFGSTDDVPGSRADVVLVLHQTDAGVTALSVPRDVVVSRQPDGASRLALTWLDGPQGLVDGLCTLGIPTDHLVTVDLGGFAAVVDAAGGLDVDVPAPVRDPAASLLLTEAGPQHVDGATALAMVRSRHPEHLVDGAWVPAPADADVRARSAGTVLSALTSTARGALLRPWRLQSMAWAVSGELSLDEETSTRELLSLATAEIGEVQVLPAGEPMGRSLARMPNSGTYAAIEAAGMSCGS
jgi:LCP family protein required for cell wall assembly